MEDSARLAATLARGLGEEGFTVEIATRGRDAAERLSRGAVDLAILDLGLPDLDGLELLAGARAQGLAVPILVLTARDGVETRVRALDLGADDYLVKPFAFAELMARVRALLRRAAAPRWAPLTLADVTLAAETHTLRIAGAETLLTPKQHAILAYLLRRCGQAVTRAEILREVFGYHFEPGTNLVDVHMAHLRRKLVASRSVRIETVRGVGYRLASGGDG